MDNITKAEKRITEIFEDREAKTKENKERISQALIKRKEVERKMNEAFDNVNFKEYQKAKAELIVINDEIEMNSKRLEKINRGELITTEEYNELVNGIYEDISEAAIQDIERVKELLNELRLISEKESIRTDHANMILETLQKNIYECRDMTQLKNGVYLRSEEKVIRDCPISELFGYISTHGFYKDLIRSKKDGESNG